MLLAGRSEAWDACQQMMVRKQQTVPAVVSPHVANFDACATSGQTGYKSQTIQVQHTRFPMVGHSLQGVAIAVTRREVLL